ncbi:conserved hypothetical protein [Desulfamplus magnetovallimortis]|uniref:Uncharacterized protein n=1 Tax=Desulfamplus magnetovallimortis TaxID=1246637 RepID=A0A1W1HDC3_9BACT|nr:hypothetical protein [Desulfamplus magnetovallimortis]SLM30479.1 conserved hypothetical protein [Desulfamplus magnetovallimortis]
MTRKITLSIPDMLYEKMEDWRKSFNLSKMFQDALTEAIHKKEEFQRRIKEDHDMSQIIERLKNEKRQSEGNYSENGKMHGFKWAKSAHYEDLMYALELKGHSQMASDKMLGSYFSELAESDHFIDISSDTINKYGKLFLDGWRKGVKEFWNEVKEKI